MHRPTFSRAPSAVGCAKVSCVCVSLAICSSTFGQISSGGTPVSLSFGLASTDVHTISLPLLNNDLLREQAEQIETLAAAAGESIPYSFAQGHDVALNLNNSGHWETLPNGSRLWRIRITSPGAYSLGLLYDDWFIPEGGRVFIYNDDLSQVIGALNFRNNWPDRSNVTPHIAGDACTVEYIEPAACQGLGSLSIYRVCHAYRAIFDRPDAISDFGDADTCTVDVACFDAPPYLNWRKGVVLIIGGGARICTGSLIANNRRDNIPYLLTANHCLINDPAHWVFMFRYESSSCDSTVDGPTNFTIANAWIRAHSASNLESDFALLELSFPVPDAYTPYFNGFTRWDGISSTSTTISHPQGDVKKIALETDPYFHSAWPGCPANSYWHVSVWDSGITEPGSSGCPLFNSSGQIVGQLRGASGLPVLCGVYNGDSYFGKLSYSWNSGSDSTSRLRDWLRPNDTGPDIVQGHSTLPPQNDVCPGFEVHLLPYRSSGTTMGAVRNSFFQCYSGFVTPDVIHTFIPGCSTQVNLTLWGANFFHHVEVTTGANCPGTSIVSCGPVSVAPWDVTQLQFSATAGIPYYISVAGATENDSGSYRIDIDGSGHAPSHDVCPGKLISDLPFHDTDGTVCANSDYSTARENSNGRDVVYTLNVPNCAFVTVAWCTLWDETLHSTEIRTGGSCPGLLQIACDYFGNQDCNGAQPLTFVAQANTDYYIIISGPGAGAAGPFTLDVSGTPYSSPNDICPATPLPLGVDVTGNTACATNDFANCAGPSSPDVVYSYSSPFRRELCVSLCGSGYDTAVELRSGGSCPGDSSVACNDDSWCDAATDSDPPQQTLQSRMSFVAEPNTSYYVIVSGWGTDSGPFRLRANIGPCVPDSLVILPTPVGIYLSWTGNGAYAYKIYGDSTANVVPTSEHLVGTSFGTSYIDSSATSETSVRRFYLITGIPWSP